MKLNEFYFGPINQQESLKWYRKYFPLCFDWFLLCPHQARLKYSNLAFQSICFFSNCSYDFLSSIIRFYCYYLWSLSDLNFVSDSYKTTSESFDFYFWLGSDPFNALSSLHLFTLNSEFLEFKNIYWKIN